LRNTGQTGGTSDADIDAPEAWNIFTGSPSVVVAVTDSGINYSHIDLGANIWVNPGESGGRKETDGIDNDGNGKIDDWHGWDFYDGDNNPMDTYSHGTHVAGTIGAVGDNNEGVVGVCWSVKLMALRVGATGPVLSCAISAIDYARAKGAKVINASWGSYTYYQSLYDAINRARTNGILFVAAAGNDQSNNDSTPHYPSSYNLDNIIAVLATDHNDNKSGFSNFGKNSVDIGAPGGTNDGTNKDIYSTVLGNNYGFKAGTSMASPHVVGVAALAWGKCPPLTYSQLKTRIINKRDYKSPLQDKCVANGRLNAYNVLYDAASPNAPTNLTARATAWQVIDLYYTDNSGNEIGFEIQRKRAGQANFSYLKSVDSNISHAQDTTATVGVSHTYKVRAYNMANVSSFTNTASATVPTGVPAAPNNLYAHNPSPPSGVNLSWNDNATNEQVFAIERQSFSDPHWTEIAEAGPNATTYSDTNVQAGETYYYRVRAYNPNGYSAYSNEITVEIFAPKK
jgi:subtilisin family serine protease